VTGTSYLNLITSLWLLSIYLFEFAAGSWWSWWSQWGVSHGSESWLFLIKVTIRCFVTLEDSQYSPWQ
jgi:hypothetical protein